MAPHGARVLRTTPTHSDIAKISRSYEYYASFGCKIVPTKCTGSKWVLLIFYFILKDSFWEAAVIIFIGTW